MKLEVMRNIFIDFFNVDYGSICDSDGNIELINIQENKKKSVKYTAEDNHLQILEWDWNEEFPVNTIIEGSPEDIIKLAKLLQDD